MHKYGIDHNSSQVDSDAGNDFLYLHQCSLVIIATWIEREKELLSDCGSLRARANITGTGWKL